MAEYKNYEDLVWHQLGDGDIVRFSSYRWSVRPTYIVFDVDNDQIFKDLWINKVLFCKEHYWYSSLWWDRPSCKEFDYAALTRCVLALYKIIQANNPSNEKYMETYVRVDNEMEYEKAKSFYTKLFPDREFHVWCYFIEWYVRAWKHNEFGTWPMRLLNSDYSHYKDITLEVLWEQRFQVHVDKTSPAGDPTSIKLTPFNPLQKPDMENLEQLKFANFAKANGKKIIEVSETLDEFTEKLETVWRAVSFIEEVTNSEKSRLSIHFDGSNKKATIEQLKKCEDTIKILSSKEFTELFKAFSAIKDVFKTK